MDSKIDTKKYIEQSLEKHNKLRAQHGTGKVKLNTQLTKIAQNYANELASKTTTQASQLLNETASQAKSNLTNLICNFKRLSSFNNWSIYCLYLSLVI